MLSPDKEKITYAERIETRDALTRIREEMSEEEGREITEAELYRRVILDFVNKKQKAKGRPPLILDTTSAPGGVEMHRRSRRTPSKVH